MKIAKTNGLMMHKHGNMLHKAKLGLASLAIAGGVASCVPAVAQNVQQDSVEIENKVQANNEEKEMPNWAKALILLGGTFVAAGLIRLLLNIEIPNDKKISELSDFERESSHDYFDR